MPLELQIIRASEFVRLSAHGHLDFQASRQALELLARACCKRALDRALLDLRALPAPAKPLFTPSQLASLVETFRDVGFGRHQRLAVLYREDPPPLKPSPASPSRIHASLFCSTSAAPL